MSSSKPTIIFANSRLPPPFFIGGAEVIVHTYFKHISKEFNCVYLGTNVSDSIDGKTMQNIYQRLKAEHIPYRRSFSRPQNVHELWHLSNYLKPVISYTYPYPVNLCPEYAWIVQFRKLLSLHKPQLVITQLIGSYEIIHESSKANIPVMLFVPDAEKENSIFIREINNDRRNAVVFNSQFTQGIFSSKLRVPSYVCYPPLDEKAYLSPSRSPQYIGMINPVAVKGGKVMERICRALPNEKFLIVKNWYDPRLDGIDFSNLPNVSLLEKQHDMRDFYGKLKLLLVPSLWQESFGCVIIEAGINSVPTIASRVGGIPEAVGEGGLLIDDNRNISSWVRAITGLLENKDRYNNLSRKAYVHAQSFNAALLGRKFASLIEKMLV